MKKAILLISVILLSGLVSATASLPLKLDFGTASSPVMSGYTQFTADAYSPSIGYGWDNLTSIYATDRELGNDLERDLHQINAEHEFLIDVPNGEYNVTLHFYDAVFSQGLMNADIEGQNVITDLMLPYGTHSTQTFETSVTDGQLTIRIYNSNPGAGLILNGLEVEEVGGCSEGVTRACQTSLDGICSEGEETCSAEEWGPCEQTVFPETETCGNGIDEDCDGSDLQCPSEGIIFEDDFDSWTDMAPEDDYIIWNTNTSDLITSSGGKWDIGESAGWSTYGKPDTEVIHYNGRLNSAAMVINHEDRHNTSGGIIKWLPERTHDELYYRWYIKYDPTWTWTDGTGQKLSRIRWILPEEPLKHGDPDDIIVKFVWARKAFNIYPLTDGRTVYANPEVCMTGLDACTKNYGEGDWISMETYIKLNDEGVNNGILIVWIDGEKVFYMNDVLLRDDASRHLTSISIGDNLDSVPWTEPEEKPMWWDDIAFSTEYIGPVECPDSIEITPENVGTCYCGTGQPNPDCANPAGPCDPGSSTICIEPNVIACEGIVDSGYCVDGVWQQSLEGGICETTPEHCKYASNRADEGDSSFENPWNITQAYTLVQAGDIVYFRGGYYDVSGGTPKITASGTADAWITFKAYPGELPHLDAKNTGNCPMNFLADGPDYRTNNIIIDGFEMSNIGETPGTSNYCSGAIKFDMIVGELIGENIIIRNNVLHGMSACVNNPVCSNRGMIMIGMINNVIVENNTIYDIGHDSQNSAGIFAMPGGYNWGPNYGINVTIRNNHIYDASGLARCIKIKYLNHGPYYIHDNVFHDCSVAVSIWALDGLEFYNNLVYNVANGVHEGSVGPGYPDGWDFYDVPNKYYNNTFYNCTGINNAALEFRDDNDVSNRIISDNIFVNCSSYATINVVDEALDYTKISSNRNCAYYPGSTYLRYHDQYDCDDGCLSFEQVQQAPYYYELGSVKLTESQAANLFVDPVNGDLHLNNPDLCPGMGAFAGSFQQCNVDAQACTISLGTINTCMQNNLQYQYTATETVENTVSGLQANGAYNIKIENLTAETEQNISGNSNSAGVLGFSS